MHVTIKTMVTNIKSCICVIEANLAGNCLSKNSMEDTELSHEVPADICIYKDYRR